VDHTVDVDGYTPILWVLSDVLGMTSTKFGVLPSLARTRCSFNRCMDHSLEPSGTLTAERGLVVHLLLTAGVAAQRPHQIGFLNYYDR
jgi:hypothetical protein